MWDNGGQRMCDAHAARATPEGFDVITLARIQGCQRFLETGFEICFLQFEPLELDL